MRCSSACAAATPRTTTARLVDRLREARPDVALTTDLIVGFPGETDADFRGDARAGARGRASSTPTRSSTRRARARPRRALPDPLPAGVLEERLEALQQLLRGLTLAAHRRRVGERTEVLVEGREPARRSAGHGPRSLPSGCELSGDRRRGPGAPATLLALRIVEATPHSLIGERLDGVHAARGSAHGRARAGR